MPIERFTKHIPRQPDSPHGQDFTLMQDRVDRTLQDICNVTIMDGVLVDTIALSTSTTMVSHKLGRKYTGYLVIYQDASASIYVDATSEASSILYIPLKASNAVNVKLWVF